MIISSYSGVLEDDLVYISAIRSMKNLTDESKLSFHIHVKLSIYQNTTFIEYLCRKDSDLCRDSQQPFNFKSKMKLNALIYCYE